MNAAYQVLYAFFANDHRWYTRKEVAAALKRPGQRLRDSDFKALEYLIADGTLEWRLCDAGRYRNAGVMRYEYRRAERDS